MAQGSTKRTFNITEEADKKLQILADIGRLDKSDNVDRAVKLYWRLLEEGKIEDPYVDVEDVESFEDMLEVIGEENDDSGLFGKFRS